MEILTVWTVFIHIAHIISLKKHERLCNNHDYCHVKMPTEYNKILKYKHGEGSLKAQFTIYLDVQCLLKKNNLVKTTLKILTQREKTSINLQAVQCLQMFIWWDRK